jgi:hypothetical protein
MKDRFSREDIETLATYSNGHCVSIYLPTVKVGPETEQNSIYLKNLLTEAAGQLEAAGMRAKDARDLLAPGADLTSDHEFWQHQSDGLALFFAEDVFYRFRLPRRFTEKALVGPAFHLKPLMPIFSTDGQFYILTLAQAENRLFRASRYTVEELEADQIPESLAEALQYDDPEKSLQRHTTGTGNDPIASMHHGHGAGDSEDNKDSILRYFRKIDAGLTDFLRDEQPPLVLVGVDYLLPIYREANTYDTLLEDGITGSPKILRPDELHQEAWEIVEKYFDAPRHEAFERFNNASGTGLSATDLDEIVPAAYYGRVDTLFVSQEIQRWGNFNPDTNKLEKFEEAGPESVDLLDRAAIQTFLNSGTVYVVDVGQIPGNGEIAAIYRY